MAGEVARAEAAESLLALKSGLAPSATTDTTNAANISSGVLPAARLPAPGASTLGGITSAAAIAHEWISAIGTNGAPVLTQPGVADVVGAAPLASPVFSGTVTLPAGPGVGLNFSGSGISYITGSPSYMAFNQGSYGTAFRINTLGAALADFVTVVPSTTGNPANVIVQPGGSDTNVNLLLRSQGTGNVQLGASGAPVVAYGPFSAPSLALNQTITASGATPSQEFFLSEALNGSVSSPNAAANSMVLYDQAAGPPGPLYALAIDHQFGGTGYSGARTPLLLHLQQTGPLSGQVSTDSYEVANLWMSIGDGTGDFVGSAYGLNPQIVVAPNSTGVNAVNAWGEGDIQIQAGATVQDKIGISVVNELGDAVQGSQLDAGFLFASQQNSSTAFATGWKTAFLLGDHEGQAPLDPNVGCVMCLQWQTTGGGTVNFKPFWMQSGINFANGFFSANAFASNGFAVSNAGVQIGAGAISYLSNGVKLDATGFTGAASIATGGTLYKAGEDIADSYGGTYNITSVGSGGAITGIVMKNVPYATSNPGSGPFTTMGGNGGTYGTAATLNIAWNAANTVQLGTTPTAVNVGGSLAVKNSPVAAANTPGAAIVAVTPGASPYAYTASVAGTLYIAVGTVSAVTLTRGGVTIPTGMTIGGAAMSAGDVVTMTYTVAPTVNFVPR